MRVFDELFRMIYRKPNLSLRFKEILVSKHRLNKTADYIIARQMKDS